MATNSTVTTRITLKRNERTAEMQTSHVSCDNLRRVFHVDPTNVWLMDDLDGSAYFPETDGFFRGLVNFQTLIVEGPDEETSASRPHATRSITTSSTTSSPAWRLPPSTGYHSVVAPKTKSPQLLRVKVVKAKMIWEGKGKPTFQTAQQLYIEVHETTANVEYILDEVRARWGASYVIVTNDGLKLEDSPATQGLAFWKVPRRSLLNFAVLEEDVKKSLKSHSSAKRSNIWDSDDDGEAVLEKPTKKKFGLIEEKLSSVIDEVRSLKSTVSEVTDLTKLSKSNLPIALTRLMRESFMCKLCHAVPLKPPINISKCCKVILGCDACVTNWFKGPDALTKICPSCGCERGFNETMILRGLDDFLDSIRNVIMTDEEKQEEHDLSAAIGTPIELDD